MHLFRVHQQLRSNPIADVRKEIFRRLDALDLDVPQAEVAITAGSRGIANIATLTKAVGDWLKSHGARPFIAPCMGSHNGATAEGQRSMIESLGMTEEAMAMEIRASMDVVPIGSVACGDVFMDRHCYEAGHVVVLNRVKLHTCFSGPFQSGLTKMMVVGMGKINSAQTFHSAGTSVMNEMLVQMGQMVLDSGRILAGLAILEDGFDKTAELHALRPEQILDEEPKLVERHRGYFPSLPVEDLNVLVVDQIGKTFSGTGMDTNVIGIRGVKYHEDLDTPRIGIIAALELAEASQGNAIGIGLADFITRRLRDAMDEPKTFTNTITTGEMQRMKIPATLESDEALFQCIADRFGTDRWMVIANTLHLGTLYVSKDLCEALAAHPRCTVDPAPVPVTFHAHGQHRLTFD